MDKSLWTQERIHRYYKVTHKIQCSIFVREKKRYIQLPKGVPFLRKGRVDSAPFMYARLLGMKRVAKKKYDVYNTCIDGKNRKMFYKCFPWMKF